MRDDPAKCSPSFAARVIPGGSFHVSLTAPVVRGFRTGATKSCRIPWLLNDLLFRRRDPVYIAFDVLAVDGADVYGLPLKDRRAILDRVAEQHPIQKSELFFGCGKTLFKAVCFHDLEGIIAKRLSDPYDARRTKWWKILNPEYSQKEGRGELFERYTRPQHKQGSRQASPAAPNSYKTPTRRSQGTLPDATPLE